MLRVYLVNFPAPGVESAISPRSSDSFSWRMVFRNEDLGARSTHARMLLLLEALNRSRKYMYFDVHLYMSVYVYFCISMCICINSLLTRNVLIHFLLLELYTPETSQDLFI